MQEIATILFLKKIFEKKFFSQFLGAKNQKSVVFMSSYLVFLKDWAELSLNIENEVTIMWSVKSVDLQNLPLLKFRKKSANYGALETNVDN